MATLSKARMTRFFRTRRGQTVRENATAYLFLSPAILLIFVFGVFPVGFAFFVSLHQWRRFPDQYQGLENYVTALGHFAYIAFFWLAVGALIYAGVFLLRIRQRSAGERRAWGFLLPGLSTAAVLLLFGRWFFAALPEILLIPKRTLGLEVTLPLFMRELGSSFLAPLVVEAGNQWLLSVAVAVGISIITFRWLKTSSNWHYWVWSTTLFVLVGIGWWLVALTVSEIQTAIDAARTTGTELPIWSQTLLISGGVALLVLAYWLWQQTTRQFATRRFAFGAAGVFALMFGGYLLVAELPRVLASADRELLSGFSVTVMFALGTVPLQLALGMVLAYLLFQNIRGRVFFRIVYFLPYITPFVATSAVFRILFTDRASAPANQVLSLIGIPAQKWLLEPKGVGTLFFGSQTPSWLAGASLALVVIMLYTIWTYVGYDAVVYLAGLGGIQPELYEVASIDGASNWHKFRYITLPLLSPTTFFLLMIAVIGTFKAFTQIYIMRTNSAGDSVNTASLYIFDTVRENGNMGYGSAMALVLFVVIVALTLLQNRIMERRVFYG